MDVLVLVVFYYDFRGWCSGTDTQVGTQTDSWADRENDLGRQKWKGIERQTETSKMVNGDVEIDRRTEEL